MCTKGLDEQASKFVVQRGDELRKCTFDEFATLNTTQEGEVTTIDTPSELDPYKFILRKGIYGKGIVRVYIEGHKPGRFGDVRVIDAFDIYPNGEVEEIKKSDEDWCGRN